MTGKPLFPPPQRYKISDFTFFMSTFTFTCAVFSSFRWAQAHCERRKGPKGIDLRNYPREAPVSVPYIPCWKPRLPFPERYPFPCFWLFSWDFTSVSMLDCPDSAHKYCFSSLCKLYFPRSFYVRSRSRVFCLAILFDHLFENGYKKRPPTFRRLRPTGSPVFGIRLLCSVH